MSELPLKGIKVLDFTWVVAGPMVSRYLTDYGATVIRVESAHRVDTARTLQPFKDGIPGAERSALYINGNAGKLGLTLNMALPEARAVAVRLAQWADVIVENYSPKAMRNWGLDYQSVCAVNPSVIMLSTCLHGQFGPDAMQAGIGTMGAMVAGFGMLTGWADRPPAGPWGAYTDYVGPRFMAAAILAALDHRRRTGQGEYIDASQVEAGVHFLGSAVLDYTTNGRIQERCGNQSPSQSPHAVFRTAGPDNWIAIVARNDAEWRTLARLAGHPEWIIDERFATTHARINNRQALENMIEAWTSGRDAAELEALLQDAGVPAHRLATSADAFADPQLLSRQHFARVEHAEVGVVPLESSRIRLSRTPAQQPSPGPTFGQHNDYVLHAILGMSDEEVAQLAITGALE